jgi:hypothetical protein
LFCFVSLVHGWGGENWKVSLNCVMGYSRYTRLHRKIRHIRSLLAIHCKNLSRAIQLLKNVEDRSASAIGVFRT